MEQWLLRAEDASYPRGYERRRMIGRRLCEVLIPRGLKRIAEARDRLRAFSDREARLRKLAAEIEDDLYQRMKAADAHDERSADRFVLFTDAQCDVLCAWDEG